VQYHKELERAKLVCVCEMQRLDAMRRVRRSWQADRVRRMTREKKYTSALDDERKGVRLMTSERGCA
jgi:hypothetical protein